MLVSKDSSIEKKEEGKVTLKTVFVEEFTDDEFKQRMNKLHESKAQIDSQIGMMKSRMLEIGGKRFVSEKTKESLKTAMEQIELEKITKELTRLEKDSAVYAKDIEALK